MIESFHCSTSLLPELFILPGLYAPFNHQGWRRFWSAFPPHRAHTFLWYLQKKNANGQQSEQINFFFWINQA
jgi:hypothetical protein